MQNETTFVDLESLKDAWVSILPSDYSTPFFQFFKAERWFAPDSPCVGMPLYLATPLSSTDTPSIYMQSADAKRLAQIVGDELQLPSIPVTPGDLVLPATMLTEIMSHTMKTHRDYLNLKKKIKQIAKRKERHRKAYEAWDEAKKLLSARQHVFLCLDIEAYELDHSILLEIGWSMYDSRLQRYQDQHYMIDQYKHLNNSKYVSDERLSFRFGTSVWSSLKQAFAELYKDMAWATERDGAFILVGHGLDSDLRYLQKSGFKWPAIQPNSILSIDMPFPLVPDGVANVQNSAVHCIINTETLFGVHKNDLQQPFGLSKCLVDLEIPHRAMHNAGNDAHYTLHLFMDLMTRSNRHGK
ncbi:hypothetical protein BC940DRAFT_245585 [Gongronella butleri]|nr:hypothetical protein BC940DRAFT_245585 [Gongronella butleri]